MTSLSDLITRSGNSCEFCGATDALSPADVAPVTDAILLCATCADDTASAGHWRCLEGAAWSAEPAVQVAVWRKLARLGEAWATEAQAAMQLSPEAEAWAHQPGALVHRDSNGAPLAQGDTVILIKDLPVKGAGFTAKRGTAVRGISLVPDNETQIEGRVEGQRIVILTAFVKKK
ncbi:MAG: PhnA domain-containing protein [Rhodobacteraceae bacterium]|nr:PhnA domain-containing protein [Paracoccaceae bacterium]